MQLVVTTAQRDRVDPLHIGVPRREATPAELAASVRSYIEEASAPTHVWLTGGEPTLREDLPAVIAAVAGLSVKVGLCTDALALVSDRGLAPLVDAGLGAVRVRLHATRADAHDWLVERKGALKRAVTAARRIVRRGLRVELASCVSRPTLAQAHEMVTLAHELGARAVHYYALPADRSDAIALTARMGLVAPPFERAQAEAERLGIDMSVAGFPSCVLGKARVHAVDSRTSESGERCEACEHGCPGWDPAYLERFGRAELRHVAAIALTDVAELDFGASPSRVVRQALVTLKMQGATTLRVVGDSMSHRDAAELLRDALRAFDEVVIEGHVHGMARLTDAELYALTGRLRVHAVFTSTDPASHDAEIHDGAFAESVAALHRFKRLTGQPIDAFVVADGERRHAPELLTNADHD